MIVLTGCDCVVTTVPVGVVWVVCVVVVIGIAREVGVVMTVPATRVGAGGGGAETTCDSGSEAQPAMRPTTPQSEKSGAKDLARFFCSGAGDLFLIVRSRLWIRRPVLPATPKPVGRSPAQPAAGRDGSGG